MSVILKENMISTALSGLASTGATDLFTGEEGLYTVHAAVNSGTSVEVSIVDIGGVVVRSITAPATSQAVYRVHCKGIRIQSTGGTSNYVVSQKK